MAVQAPRAFTGFVTNNKNPASSDLARFLQVEQQRQANKAKIANDAQRLSLAEQELDFNMAAPEREKQKLLDQRAFEAEKAQTATGIAKGLAFGGADQFFGNEQVIQALEADPKYQALGDSEKLAYRNQFIQQNAGLFQDPTNYASQVRDSLAASGLYNMDEINSLTSNAVSQQFPTMDKEVALKLLDTGKKGSSSSIELKLPGTKQSASGSFAHEFDVTDPTFRQQASDRISSNYNLDTSTGWLERAGRAVGTDVTPSRAEVDQAFGLLAQRGIVSGTAAEAAIQNAFGVDGDLKDSMDWRTPEGQKKLFEAADRAQKAETQKFNKKTGQSQSADGADATATLAARNQYNNQILSRLSPTAATQADILNKFLGGLGSSYEPAKATGGKPILAPKDDKKLAAPDTKAGKQQRAKIADETASKKLLSDNTPAPAPEAEFRVGLTEDEKNSFLFSSPITAQKRRERALLEEEAENAELAEGIAQRNRGEREMIRLQDLFIPRSGITGF